MEKKVIVAGHICVDITPVFPPDQNRGIHELLMPGRLVQVEEADIHTGGAVANTGLAMKKFGMDVSLMGKVGTDAFGTMVQNILSDYGAGEDLLIDKNVSTAYSIVLAVPGTDRIFLHNPGANDTFTFDDIPIEKLKNATLFHFGYPPLMKSIYQDNGEELVRLFRQVKEMGLITSLDMAAMDETTPAGQADWKKILSRVLPFVDFFVPSAEELCFMLDKERFESWRKRAGNGEITEVLEAEKDIKPLANLCMELGAGVLLVKCGAPGLYYRTADCEKMNEVLQKLDLRPEEWCEKEGFEKSYRPDRVLSATGAGDTTIAAFLSAALRKNSLAQALHLGTAAGASCVTAYDALSGLRTLEELQEKIEGGWKKC